jgi:hypothetical protein
MGCYSRWHSAVPHGCMIDSCIHSVFPLRHRWRIGFASLGIFTCTSPSTLLPVPLRSTFVICSPNPGGYHIYALTSLYGYFALSSFLSTIFLFFFVLACSTHTSLVIDFVNSRMKRGSQSSEAIPRSLQQRIRALDLQPSVAVGMPSGSKYCCSPRAMETRLREMLVGVRRAVVGWW